MAASLSEATFDEVVAGSDVPVLIEFWAEWCPPCRVLAPVLDSIVAENGAVLYWPGTDKVKRLAGPPPAGFVRALRKRGVEPLTVGRVIVSTERPHDRPSAAGLGHHPVPESQARIVLAEVDPDHEAAAAHLGDLRHRRDAGQ